MTIMIDDKEDDCHEKHHHSILCITNADNDDKEDDCHDKHHHSILCITNAA